MASDPELASSARPQLVGGEIEAQALLLGGQIRRQLQKLERGEAIAGSAPGQERREVSGGDLLEREEGDGFGSSARRKAGCFVFQTEHRPPEKKVHVDLHTTTAPASTR